jgi:hypothetical protein
VCGARPPLRVLPDTVVGVCALKPPWLRPEEKRLSVHLPSSTSVPPGPFAARTWGLQWPLSSPTLQVPKVFDTVSFVFAALRARMARAAASLRCAARCAAAPPGSLRPLGRHHSKRNAEGAQPLKKRPQAGASAAEIPHLDLTNSLVRGGGFEQVWLTVELDANAGDLVRKQTRLER